MSTRPFPVHWVTLSIHRPILDVQYNMCNILFDWFRCMIHKRYEISCVCQCMWRQAWVVTMLLLMLITSRHSSTRLAYCRSASWNAALASWSLPSSTSLPSRDAPVVTWHQRRNPASESRGRGVMRRGLGLWTKSPEAERLLVNILALAEFCFVFQCTDNFPAILRLAILALCQCS